MYQEAICPVFKIGNVELCFFALIRLIFIFLHYIKHLYKVHNIPYNIGILLIFIVFIFHFHEDW